MKKKQKRLERQKSKLSVSDVRYGKTRHEARMMEAAREAGVPGVSVLRVL